MSRVLVIEDNETMRTGVVLVMERMGHQAEGVAGGGDGLARLREQAYDLVITDYRMEGMDGLEVLATVKREWPQTDVVLITAFGTIEIAVEAMKIGAADFVTKPFPPDALRLKVERVLDHRQTRLDNERLGEENRYLREEIGGRHNFGEMVGDSPAMREVFATVKKVAASDSAILVYGESGTGKELVARAIHRHSGRSDGPFVKVNCGALPRELVESELFGHEKGAFTGATRRKKGKFELAEGGTIFLDEVGDIPLEVQVHLLRVLQEGEFDPVGGEATIQADVRVVAATHRPLREMVGEGRFREDLFYRLEVIPVQLPPLRERRGDIPALAEHFLHKKCAELGRGVRRFADSARQALAHYGWPGNVRELENVVERTVVLSDGDEIGLSDLPLVAADTSPLGTDPTDEAGDSDSLNQQLEDLERRLIEKALQRSGGVKTQAAELLGIKTSALYYKLDKYGLQ